MAIGASVLNQLMGNRDHRSNWPPVGRIFTCLPAAQARVMAFRKSCRMLQLLQFLFFPADTLESTVVFLSAPVGNKLYASARY